MGKGSISRIIGTISSNGILYPHKYYVMMNIPTSCLPPDTNINEVSYHLAPRIERVNLPTISMETMDYYSTSNTTRPIIKSRSANEPLSINIILSEDIKERKWLEYWFNQIHSLETGYITKYYDDYVGSIQIEIFSTKKDGGAFGGYFKEPEDERMAFYTFKNVYPTSIGDIELSYGETDTYTTMAATFNWEYFELA